MYDNRIAKNDLIHGAYYAGHCRNAEFARWDERIQKFIYRRYKFGTTFLEEIEHPEDDRGYDTFIVDHQLVDPPYEIKLRD